MTFPNAALIHSRFRRSRRRIVPAVTLAAASHSATRQRRIANGLVIFGCLLGVTGMLAAFSWPGAALILAGHGLIVFSAVYSLVRQPSIRQAVYSVVAIAIIWSMLYLPRVTQLF